ncbi:MAG: tetratricopeptide repeat protein [Bacteroidetes bacterium]|nr:tetratricopeptide repeat protein [Bacteroidota bacterium]
MRHLHWEMRFLKAVILVFLCLLFGSSWSQKELEFWMDKAQVFKSGNADSILTYTKKIMHHQLANAPILAECYYLNAIGYDKKGNYPLAERAIGEAALQFKAQGDDKGWYKSKVFSAWIEYNKGEVLMALDSVSFYLSKIESQLDIEEMDEEWLKIMGNGYSDMGLYYSFFKDKVRALNSFDHSAEYRERLNDQDELAELSNNVGLMLLELESFQEAEIEFKKSLNIVQKLKNRSAEASCYHNLGKCFKEQNKLDSALIMYGKCLDIRIALKERKGISSVLRKIAAVHRAKEDFAQAFVFVRKARALSQTIGDRKGLIDAEFSLAELHGQKGRDDSAFWYGQRAYINSKEMGAIADIKRTAAFMKERYKAQGMLAEALIASEDVQLAESKMNDDDVRRMFLKKQYDEKQNRANQIIFGVSIIAVLLVGLVFFVFRAYRIKQKSNELIGIQKSLLEEKNIRIVESITYSLRLQQAMMPSISALNEIFKKIKVSYLAKDIVSGDFYWAKQVGDWKFLVVGDCTGHGVPGAMVSTVGINSLNQATMGLSEISTAEILNSCRSEMIKTFGQQGEMAIRDGMDVAMLAINDHARKVVWSGANRSCWFWNGQEWLILKGDRQSISWSDQLEPFTETWISNVCQGARFCLFSDGLNDQFGGDNNKKLGNKRIKDFFSEVNVLTLDKQHDDLELLWKDWKGDNEQTDDFCMISIEI